MRNTIYGIETSELPEERPLKNLIQRHLADVAALDNELGWITRETIDSLPVVRPRLTLNIHGLVFKLIRSLGPRPRFIVLLNALTRGGADLYAVSLYKALSELYGTDSTVLLITDRRVDDSRHWLPPDAKILFLDDLQPALDFDSKRYILYQMVSLVRPQAIFNVNSKVIWDYIAEYGASLTAFTALYSELFCYDYRSDGVPGGFAAFSIRDSLHHHTAILLDNNAFGNQLADDYCIPPSLREKFHTLYTPLQELEGNGTVSQSDSANSQVVLWAGRFAFQKKPLLAIEIARLCPEYAFHFHGEGDPEITRQMAKDAPPNVRFFGPFKSMEALLQQGYGLLLYTSVTDGVPTVIQGAARFGVTVVAGSAGGIGELVRSDTGWLVADADDPSAYAAAIREAMAQTSERAIRSENMLNVVNEQHSPERFARDLKKLIEETSSDPL